MAKGHSEKALNAPRGVSQARLSQKSGVHNSFGGYAKVKNGNGSFTMKKTGK